MSVGDITSTDKGTGARFNDGKPPLAWIPLGVMIDGSKLPHPQAKATYTLKQKAIGALSCLQTWTLNGTVHNLLLAATILDSNGDWFGNIAWDECAQVFDYGAKKYAPGNWEKGMKWSVPFNSALRHLRAIYNEEEIDPESKLPHRGHFLCNIVMLYTYSITYKEGNDINVPIPLDR